MSRALGDTQGATGSIRGAPDGEALPQTFSLCYTGFLQSKLVSVTSVSAASIPFRHGAETIAANMTQIF